MQNIHNQNKTNILKKSKLLVPDKKKKQIRNWLVLVQDIENKLKK